MYAFFFILRWKSWVGEFQDSRSVCAQRHRRTVGQTDRQSDRQHYDASSQSHCVQYDRLKMEARKLRTLWPSNRTLCIFTAVPTKNQQENRCIAGRTARCRCKCQIFQRHRTYGFTATARLYCWSLPADCSDLHHFRDIAGLCTSALLHSNFGCVPVGPDHRCWGSIRTFTLSYSAVKLFSKYSNPCDHGTWTSQTDRQTDRKTDNILWHNRALRSIAR